ncbi:hypothetical protein ACQ4LE_000649 [Meloidogyne hapla]
MLLNLHLLLMFLKILFTFGMEPAGSNRQVDDTLQLPPPFPFESLYQKLQEFADDAVKNKEKESFPAYLKSLSEHYDYINNFMNYDNLLHKNLINLRNLLTQLQSIPVTRENYTQIEKEIQSNIKDQRNIIKTIKENQNNIANKYFQCKNLEGLGKPPLCAKPKNGETSANQGYGIYPPKALEPIESYPKADHLGKQPLIDQNSHNVNNALVISKTHAGLKHIGGSQNMGPSSGTKVYGIPYPMFLQPSNVQPNGNYFGIQPSMGQPSQNLNTTIVGGGGLKLKGKGHDLGQPIEADYLGKQPSLDQSPEIQLFSSKRVINRKRGYESMSQKDQSKEVTSQLDGSHLSLGPSNIDTLNEEEHTEQPHKKPKNNEKELKEYNFIDNFG